MVSDVGSCPSMQKYLNHPNHRIHAYCAVLTEAQAIEVYGSLKQKTLSSRNMKGFSARSIAAMYQVSPKTIRDIWARRKWKKVTRHLWTEEESPGIRNKGTYRGVAKNLTALGGFVPCPKQRIQRSSLMRINQNTPSAFEWFGAIPNATLRRRSSAAPHNSARLTTARLAASRPRCQAHSRRDRTALADPACPAHRL